MKWVAFGKNRFRTGENEKRFKFTSPRPCHQGGFFLKTLAGIFLILKFYIINIIFVCQGKEKELGNKYDKIVVKAVKYLKTGTLTKANV